MADKEKILVCLPSPMGDAVLCTPALRAIRRKFADAEIFFLANGTVKQILTPCAFNDQWIDAKSNPVATGAALKKYGFSKGKLVLELKEN